MSSKHTEGPWTIGDVTHADVQMADGTRHERLAANIHHPGNLSWPIMRIGASSDDDLDEVMANARLVVGASDLLAAAKDLRKRLYCALIANGTDAEFAGLAVADADAAIAQAEGRS